jgi:uncharacterized protein YprB with RNaseH-like and TPR domain
MSRLLERLRLLHRASSNPHSEAVEPPKRPVFLPPNLPSSDLPVTLAPAIPFREVERQGTRCLWGRLHLSADTAHGGLALTTGLQIDASAAYLLSGDERLRNFDVTRAAFFDLETTGLLGGSGNLAFLTGLVRIAADGSVTVHQVLLRHPGEEVAGLDVLRELINEVDYLVSFNGKSFDRNVLADRFVMNRMCPERVLQLPHLDLLHPARRLYGGLLPSCSLSALEESILAVHRPASEIRGADVPGRWFDFLRTGSFDLLQPVIEHNLLDILSLVTLGGHLARCLADPMGAITQKKARVAAGRLLIERGEAKGGEHILRSVASGDAADSVVYSAIGLLADVLRKTGRHQQAHSLWARMMDARGARDLEPWIGSAIALEHRLGRPAEALALVNDLLGRILPGDICGFEREQLNRRRDRLVRKAEESQSGRARSDDLETAGFGA